MNGVEYEYERPYEYETSDRQYRQYRPDFYLPAIKTYLEHYALDKNGNPPAIFGKRYSESLRWKEQLHAEKGTSLITTTFVAWKLLAAYEAKLRSSGEIDFEDMIIRATHDVAANRYQHQYRLILVDEFQDISQARAKLLKMLLLQVPDCKLFAVGDDWQSIYRFAGSDIDVFTHFPGHFGTTATNYLTKTFRSNQGITDVASRFVQKNPSQMKKRVSAQDKTTQAVLVIRRYDKLEDIDKECEECLTEIASKKAAGGKGTTVFILARYRFQKPGSLGNWKARFRASVDITFKTIHSSKGLEADYVIVLGMHTGRYAFPSEISDDPLLQLVMPQAESFPNAEERRLFYVGLTRARRGIYLLGSSYSPSSFFTELVEDESLQSIVRDEQRESEIQGNGVTNPPAAACPRCQQRQAQKKNRQVRGVHRLLHLPELRVHERCR